MSTKAKCEWPASGGVTSTPTQVTTLDDVAGMAQSRGLLLCCASPNDPGYTVLRDFVLTDKHHKIVGGGAMDLASAVDVLRRIKSVKLSRCASGGEKSTTTKDPDYWRLAKAISLRVEVSNSCIRTLMKGLESVRGELALERERREAGGGTAVKTRQVLIETRRAFKAAIRMLRA